MKNRNKIISSSLILMLLIALAFANIGSNQSLAASQIKLIIDGKDVTASAIPVIENDRTLVPIRIIAEQLGAKVTWNAKDRTVLINKDSVSILLKIDSRLVQYQKDGKNYFLSDVAPKIIKDRTFVPLRLISNALGIGIEWSATNRVVNVDSSKTATFTPIFDMKIMGLNPGQVISDRTQLQVSLPSTIKGATEIKYLLLDSKTAQGVVVGRSSDISSKQLMIPSMLQNGERVLVAALYDAKGNFLAGDSIPVNINIEPKVILKGISQGQTVTENLSLSADVNFIASYIKYEITNLDKSKTTLTTEADPQGSYSWNPQVDDTGNYAIRVIAYDENNKGYEGEFLTFRTEITPKISLGGVKAGQTIDKPVNLIASINFDVRETEYFLRDINTGVEQTIAKIPYGGYKWFPGVDLQGTKEAFVRVKDTKENVFESNGVEINLAGKPKLLLEGIGPKQVLTATGVKLKTNSNVTIDSVNYIVTNIKTGARSVIPSGVSSTSEYTYIPKANGDFSIQAEGIYNSGNKIYSESIPYKVFLGKTYGAKPIIEKNKFLGLASGLARTSWEKTGMSAALQTAQAILETAWGQSVPVDKYSGKFSNNLFGIKGSTSAGSVISNTWEEYNGTTFRIDAEFRAYNNINDSWNDHKKLLEKERYGIFRDVMYDSTLGAWAIRRAGYATDSKYPLKLMKLIKDNDLEKLDRIGI